MSLAHRLAARGFHAAGLRLRRAPAPVPARRLRPPATPGRSSSPARSGCRNDGSVELCLPKDPSVVAKARQIAPSLEAKPGRGRAGCDLTRTTLYLLPTRSPKMCTGDGDAMTEAGWKKVCRLAAIPEVERIVATFYE